MKKKSGFWLLASGFWLLLCSCGNTKENTNVQIKGKLSNSNGETIMLMDVNSPQVKTIDSVKVNQNGEFVFTKKVPVKGFYTIQITQANYATIIADSTEKIIIEGDAKNLKESYKVSGSKDSEIFLQFSNYTQKKFKVMESIRNQQDSIRRVYEAYMNTTHDAVRLDSLSKMLEPKFNAFSEEYRKLADETSAYIRKFIDENVSSFASLAAVQMLNPERDIAYFVKVSDALTAKYPAVANLKGFQTYVERQKKLALGMPAPEITMNDRDEKPLSLSSLKGKVVIVDFWASWCKPCRAGNPFVVSLYNKYKDKGLDVFSVSLDFKKDAWFEAIAKDKLTWKNHVCDFKQWQSPVVALYGFSGIPFTCLLDKNGNIAGKNLQGPELEEKIQELLGMDNLIPNNDKQETNYSSNSETTQSENKQKEQDNKIREELKAQAMRDWPDDYTTQEYWVNKEIGDYEYMKTIPNNDRIKRKAEQDWPLDFSTQKYWYNEQIKAKERMK